MRQPIRIITPVEEVRFQMTVALTVAPRHVLTILGKPHHQQHEQYRKELIALLTRGWEDWQIVRTLNKDEATNLQALLSTGRAKLFPCD